MTVDRYRVNDALTNLATEAGAVLGDDTLNELTHHISDVLDANLGTREATSDQLPWVITDDEGEILARFATDEEARDALDTGDYDDFGTEIAYINEATND